MQSIWEKDARMPSFPKLEEDKKTDVLIIGGGFAGLLCAWFLQQHGVEYCLIEAGRLAEGTSGHTTAKITAQHGLIYHKLAARYGLEAAKMYYDINQMALGNYRVLCQNIKCDFEEKDSVVYSTKNRDKLEREMKTLQRIGGEAVFAENLPLPFATCGGVSFLNQAQFHPLKFLAELTKGLSIYENTRAIEFRGRQGKRTVITNRGKIAAEKIVIATHFPMLNKHGFYFAKLYQHRSYVLTLKNVPRLPEMYVDEDRKGHSFRTWKEYLLFGGGGHRTGKKGGGFAGLRSAAEVFYPEAEEVCHFAAQDCLSLDDIPYIGAYAKETKDLFVATGFQKWGMTSSMTAAMLLSDLLLEKKNAYAALFSPSRNGLTGQLFLNIAEAMAGLLMPFGKRCPHLGCALKWNKEEHSWDCPCHGSRFSEDGKVLNNPANNQLK